MLTGNSSRWFNRWWRAGLAVAVVLLLISAGLYWAGISDWYKANRPFLDGTASVATLVGLVFAYKQLRDARSQSRVMARIVEGMSTRYIGPFPEGLREVRTIIESANESLVIVCDFPAYGLFTAPEASLGIRDALLRKRLEGRVTVHLTCYAPSQRRDLTLRELQYLLATVGRSALLAQVSKALRGIAPQEHQPDDEFVGTLAAEIEREDEGVLGNVFKGRGADVREVSHPIPVYLWVADSSRAVIAIPATDGSTTEHAFQTRDVRLIEAILEMHRRLLAAPALPAASQAA